jgi:hypothetical protein
MPELEVGVIGVRLSGEAGGGGCAPARSVRGGKLGSVDGRVAALGEDDFLPNELHPASARLTSSRLTQGTRTAWPSPFDRSSEQVHRRNGPTWVRVKR